MFTVSKCTLSTKRTFRHLPVPTHLSFEFLLKITLCSYNFTGLYWNNVIGRIMVRCFIFSVNCKIMGMGIMGIGIGILISLITSVSVDPMVSVVKTFKRIIHFSVLILWLLILIIRVVAVEKLIVVSTIDHWFHIHIHICNHSLAGIIHWLVWAYLRLQVTLRNL